MIRLRCRACGEQLKAPSSVAGTGWHCPHCGREAIVPHEAGPLHPDTAADTAQSAGRDVFMIMREPYLPPKLWAQTRRARRLATAMRLLLWGAVLVFLLLVYPGALREDPGSAAAVFGTFCAVQIVALILRRYRLGSVVSAAVHVLLGIGLVMVWRAWVIEPRMRSIDTMPVTVGEEPIVQSIPSQPGAWEGFRDLAWGTRAEGIAGLELVHRDGQEAVYTRPDDDLTIGEAQLHGIKYAFHRGALGEVELSCLGRSGVRAFREATIARFGRNDADVRFVGNAASWEASGHSSDGGEVTLAALFSFSKAIVTITYTPPTDEPERDQQPAASDSRPTTGESR